MDDLISRMAAIVIIRSLYPSEPYLKGNRERWRERYKHYIEAEEALKRLPSAQPERKTATWVKTEFNYCPNCGARMEV